MADKEVRFKTIVQEYKNLPHAREEVGISDLYFLIRSYYQVKTCLLFKSSIVYHLLSGM